MKTKTYGVRQLMEFGLIITIGEQHKEILFTGGVNMADGTQIPATFTTNNPIVQYSIEQSPEYKTGRVFEIKSNAEVSESSTAGTDTPVAKKTSKNKVVKSVKTINDAIDFMESQGVSVNSDSDLEAAMEQMNIEFPNLKK